jgi:hypothetical protein
MSRPTRRAALHSASLGPTDAEHKPVTIAEVIAGGQTISTHCLACGHRGELETATTTSKLRPRRPLFVQTGRG